MCAMLAREAILCYTRRPSSKIVFIMVAADDHIEVTCQISYSSQKATAAQTCHSPATDSSVQLWA